MFIYVHLIVADSSANKKESVKPDMNNAERQLWNIEARMDKFPTV